MNDDIADVTPEVEPEAVAEPVVEGDPDSVETFSADYVAKLREESASHRVKAKRVDDANVRLVSAYAKADGRLVDVDVLTYSDDLLDDDGIVDPDKVTGAIAALLEVKPYLASRRPTSPLPQGVREDVPATPGLFDLIRARA